MEAILWLYKIQIARHTLMFLVAFLTDGLEKSKNFTVKSLLPDASSCSCGWKSNHVISWNTRTIKS